MRQPFDSDAKYTISGYQLMKLESVRIRLLEAVYSPATCTPTTATMAAWAVDILNALASTGGTGKTC